MSSKRTGRLFVLCRMNPPLGGAYPGDRVYDYRRMSASGGMLNSGGIALSGPGSCP